MKKITLFAIAITAINTAKAQNQTPITTTQTSNGVIDRMAVEVGYGYNMALSSEDKQITLSDYNQFKTFHAGVRIAIDNTWGLRGTYTNTTFAHKNFSDQGTTVNRLVAEATYNFFPKMKETPFQLMAHAGFGLGKNKSKTLKGNDMIGAFQIGVMPEYYITSQLGIYLDCTYMLNLSQDYSFSGRITEKGTASMFVPSVGVSYKFK